MKNNLREHSQFIRQDASVSMLLARSLFQYKFASEDPKTSFGKNARAFEEMAPGLLKQ